MPECANCGGHVTRDYVRVFGVEGDVHACRSCADTTEIFRGAASQSRVEIKTKLAQPED